MSAERPWIVPDHPLAERTSLALHKEVALRLRTRPAILEAARRRVERWREEGGAHPWYVAHWAELLSGPVDALLELLVADTEDARTLRQVSPFAGALDARTRWRIWRAVRGRAPPAPAGDRT